MASAGGIKTIASASLKLHRRMTSLQYVSSVHFTFDAFDPRMKGQREFHRRVMGRKLRATNPKCEISFKQTEDMAAPTTTISFDDGHKIMLETAGMVYEDIAEEVNSHVQVLALEQILAEGEKYKASGGGQ